MAYLNGVEVARDRLRQDEPTFDSTALSRPSAQTTEFFNVVISEHAHLLESGQNLLAIQGINTSANGNDLLVLPSLVEGIVVGGGGEIPKAQQCNPTIDFGAIDFNPASGNQEEEYIALVNNQDFAVDISGWSLQGDVRDHLPSRDGHSRRLDVLHDSQHPSVPLPNRRTIWQHATVRARQLRRPTRQYRWDRSN